MLAEIIGIIVLGVTLTKYLGQWGDSVTAAGAQWK